MKKINYVISVFLLLSAFSSYAIEDKHIALSIYHDDSDLWHQIFEDNQDDLIKQLQVELNDKGFDISDIRFCMNQSDNQCKSQAASAIDLNMFLYDIKRGEKKKKKGFNFSLEFSNPRQVQTKKKTVVDLLSIKCRLVEPQKKKLIDMTISEQAVKKQYFSPDDFDVKYVSEKLSDACFDVLTHKEVIALRKKGSDKKSTPYPGVYVEEKKVKTLSVNNNTVQKSEEKPTEIVKVDDETVAVQKDSKENDKESDEVSIEKQVSTEDEKTQYIIHTKSSKVIIDFGRQR